MKGFFAVFKEYIQYLWDFYSTSIPAMEPDVAVEEEPEEEN